MYARECLWFSALRQDYVRISLGFKRAAEEQAAQMLQRLGVQVAGGSLGVPLLDSQQGKLCNFNQGGHGSIGALSLATFWQEHSHSR